MFSIYIGGNKMTKKEMQKTIRTMNEVAKKVGKSKNKRLKLLVATGSYTRNGNLKKSYKQSSSD